MLNDIDELFDLMDEKFGEDWCDDNFWDAIYNQDSNIIEKIATELGIEFEYVDYTTEYASGLQERLYTYKIDGKFYQTQEWYNSWDGTEQSCEFYEVVPVPVIKYVPIEEVDNSGDK